MDYVEIPQDLMRGEPPKVDALPVGCWVAGGAVRRWFVGEKQSSDIDIFCASDEAQAEFVRANGLSSPASTTPRATTFARRGLPPIQVIAIRFGDVRTCLSHFDFTICQFGWDGSAVIASVAAIACALRRTLAVASIQPGFEVDSLRRAFRYARAGYHPCGGAIRDLAKALSNVEPERVAEQAGVALSARWD